MSGNDDRPSCSLQPECVTSMPSAGEQVPRTANRAPVEPTLTGRVAVVTYHTSPLAVPGQGDSGGLNVYVRDLAASLRSRGIAADIFCRRDDPDVASVVSTSDGVRVVHVPAGPAASVPKSELSAHIEDFSERLALLLEDGGYGLIHSHYWMSGLAALSAAKAADAPVVHTAHTLATLRALPDGGGERLAAERRLAAEADLLVASTPHEADALVGDYGAAACRIEVIPPGVDHCRFFPGDSQAARARTGLGDSDLVVLFAGRVQELKGADLAADALLELSRIAPHLARRVTFVLAGGASGDDGERTLARVRRTTSSPAFLPSVRFLPARPHDEVPDLFRAADVCLVPSRSESFGLVALEAQASGVPVVASAVDGLLHVVKHGRGGVLVPGGKPHGFAEALRTLLANDWLRVRMGRDAQRLASAYSWTLAAERHRDAYVDLMEPQRMVVCG